ncbi:hypothetical protein T484DRAFT_1765475 [Baffinella frigidus]|nr:hypothetical protein T484DRAFT_1765475 [Cryptophyta sp. CCMP2293]
MGRGGARTSADDAQNAKDKAEKAANPTGKKKEAPKPLDPLTIAMNELKSAMQTMDKAVASKEARYMSRVIRMVTKLRRMLSKAVLTKAIETYMTADSAAIETYVGVDSAVRAAMLEAISGIVDPEPMQVEVAPVAPVAAAPAVEVAPVAPVAAAPAAAAGAKEGDKKEGEAQEEEKAEEKTKEKEEAAFFKKMVGIPEAEVFVQLLVTIFLLDQKAMQGAVASSALLIQRATSFNRRTMDQLQSRGYFYWARCMELMGKSSEIRHELLTAYRTCSLKHDQVGQATLLNLLLRNYMEFNLYEQADTLMRKTAFPEGDASNNQLARYLYYTGRIKAVQLEYTDAFRETLLQQAQRKAPQASALGFRKTVHKNLQQAQRKAPQASALGFRKTVHKFQIIVQLLIGEIPDRSTFSQKGMVESLRPYLHITQAVRVGDLTAFHKAMQDLTAFHKVMQEHGAVFKADKTYSLIVRLRHNVIKTGLKKINTAYSAITLTTYSLIVRLRHNVTKTGLKKINTAYSATTLTDVCAKLGLE